ncbi:MAG: alpha/beta hydrolase [Oscillospiraceae bacterium]|jgi:triacylglycerol lipase|nr:alpha/beta hydrolase [Oscillospiraceae bacterium]
MLLALIITILVILFLCLDIFKKISLMNFKIMGIYLIIAPHLFLLCNLLLTLEEFKSISSIWRTLIIVETVAFFIYVWIKFNIVPKNLTQDVSLRFKVMMNGRHLCLTSIYVTVIQTIICILGYFVIKPFHVKTHICVIDLIITIFCVFFLLANGILRIFFTSRRLSIVRRLVLLFTVWIPIINIIIILYCCYIIALEYDHQCYKVINRNARVDSFVCKAKYPLVMVHGVGFRDFKYVNYWGRIPKELIRNGATVYYGNQEAFGTIDYNAKDMKQRILQIIEETGCEKVNIIAHSKGGLDARYMISMLDMGDYVASLTTMSSPHRGSKVIDKIVRMPDGLFQWIAKIMNKYFRKIGDQNPDFYTAVSQFSTTHSKDFNDSVKDVPKVYYQSYTSVMKSMFSDSLLCIPYCIVKPFEKENDGLVCIESAMWGNFRGVFRNKYRRGISHGDIIDLKREDYKGFDVIEKYVEIVSELKQMGF